MDLAYATALWLIKNTTSNTSASHRMTMAMTELTPSLFQTDAAAAGKAFAFSLRHCRQMSMTYDLERAYKRWLQFENVPCTHLYAVLRKIEISATRCQIFRHQI